MDNSIHIRKLVLRVVFVVLVASGLMACLHNSNTHDDGSVSMVTVDELLIDIDFFNGKTVEVDGFLVLEFENKNLYSFDQDKGLERDASCVTVEMENHWTGELTHYNRKEVSITGKFVDDMCGAERICFDACTEAGIIVEEVVFR